MYTYINSYFLENILRIGTLTKGCSDTYSDEKILVVISMGKYSIPFFSPFIITYVQLLKYHKQ